MTEPPPNAIPSALEQLRHALASGTIDQATFDLLAPAAMGARLAGPGAIAQGPDATAIGAQGVDIGGDHQGDITTGRRIDAAAGTVVYAEEGATIVIGEAPVAMTAVDRQSTLGRYLQHLIAQNRYLQLQGIRSGGKLVNIELDRIYVTLRASRQPARRTELDWLADERALAPGDPGRDRNRGAGEAPGADTATVTVNQALAEHRRLVVLGDPGSGKTTLLRYLALLYARDLAEDRRLVRDTLGLAEPGTLPVLLPLRQIGRFLAEHRLRDDGTEGHAILLELLVRVLKNERIELPVGFFDDWLNGGRAAVLLDGLDEVADPRLRRRVARLVDAFTRAYPDCRYGVTSRVLGYTDSARLGEGYAITTVRDFSPDDIRVFLTQWHRLVAVGQLGPGETAEGHAARQTEQLIDAIDKSERVRELAINPLMLTVIALIHRDRVKLPDRRAELYQEAVDVLLGKWDEARGVPESLILSEGPFDIGDRRLVLQHVALAMHEQGIKEIDAGPLRALLADQLRAAVAKPRELDACVTRFLQVIQERTGLLIARAEGTYAFSHLTFQEYLAALSIAGRDDYLKYSLARCPDPWWRETILLEAGALSTQSKEKTSRLIRAIADARKEPEPYHNLVLAAECLRDAGANRVLGDLETEIRGRLKREVETPSRGMLGVAHSLLIRGTTPQQATRRRIAAAEALSRIGGTQFWTRPYGEPEWVRIPAGPFTMGEADQAHRVDLADFAIARVPITNAQYRLFVQATGHRPPDGWDDGRIPKGKEGHPVVEVDFHDALAYCRWLSESTGQPITLPSEAEWEKAARGGGDPRAYPWGDTFDSAKCNTAELGLSATTPAGIFPGGASPYGCLDMAGNVWEWTRSLWGTHSWPPDFAYPYDSQDERREALDAGYAMKRLVRGGSWADHPVFARCAFRSGLLPDDRLGYLGFRVVLRAAPVSSAPSSGDSGL
jgi:formylglycine-generating enzyme required for sulfatase activity/energy-coupling factor transporter ATP-binding protein EcfA2